MSSLWTPGGEHRVPRDQPAAPGAPATGAGADAGAGAGAASSGEAEPASADEQAAREHLAALEAELVQVPAADVVANHCYGLFELAAVHLGQQPPAFEEAQVAIDALGAVVEQLGERLGQSAPMLVEALAQIRLAFVQLAAPRAAGAGDGGAGPAASEPGGAP